MATYKGINGFAVQSVATDPSPLDEGQVWYNNATYAFKLASVTTAGTWATGGNLNTARAYAGAAGTQTAGLFFGGISYPSFYNVTESYNGTSWTTLPATMNTTRYGLGSANAGTQTAALGFGGEGPGSPPTTATESYNGTSWTNVNSLTTAKIVPAGAGTQTTALAFGGDPNSSNSQTWNGTSWTNTPSLNTSRGSLAGFGASNTAALAAGGENPFPSISAATESYNGTSWTTVSSMNTARGSLGGFGTQTNGVVAAGRNSSNTPQTATEVWNGTSWTSNPNGLSTGRYYPGGFGSGSSSGAITGGYPNPATAATEEWTGPGVPVTQTITTS
jgi:hypothetical protein